MVHGATLNVAVVHWVRGGCDRRVGDGTSGAGLPPAASLVLLECSGKGCHGSNELGILGAPPMMVLCKREFPFPPAARARRRVPPAPYHCKPEPEVGCGFQVILLPSPLKPLLCCRHVGTPRCVFVSVLLRNDGRPSLFKEHGIDVLRS